MKSESNRIEWVDISKGLGILLVIIGHCVYLGGTLHNWIFSFHMPLFFTLSGLFLHKEDVRIFVKKKIHSLILSYVIFCVIGFLFTIIIPLTRETLTVKGIFSDIYYANPENINVSSVWFLVCLFVSMMVLQIIFRIKILWVQKLVILGAAVAGFLFARYRIFFSFLPGERLPFNVDVAMVAVLFISIGYYYRDKILSVAEYLDGIPVHQNIFIFILFFVASIVVSALNGRVNVHGLQFNNEILFLIGAALGTSAIICLSMLIKKTQFLRNCIEWLGRESIVILGIQALMVRLYVLVFSRIFNQSLTLYYLTGIHVLLATIFVTVSSVFIALLFCKCRNHVCHRI